MEIRLNGESYKLPPGVQTAEDLLHHLGIDQRIVVMEQNRTVLEREQWKETRINVGDELEIVHFVGGG
ncbi:sulfur carrier protein ThiS [Kroppenstedtia pulmonis]|uniref:Sulfur carrier protein ThiS n=1 Tax=Kroppenstedtia pulmonis TaxID=1380685 RepID=A0A7D4BWJ0_9BACL|nr:sulfur carrier protein ThiS [Kroppenstedtia pulmonis]QKG84913.1 sulfur carrier protein ThiS [Kroppenstedtia pulmonis]